METKEEFRVKVHSLMQNADIVIKETNEYLLQQGRAVDLTEWVRIDEYCRRFGIEDTETVMQWIEKGIVPKDDTAIIGEYNNARMLKAKPYLKNAFQDL